MNEVTFIKCLALSKCLRNLVIMIVGGKGELSFRWQSVHGAEWEEDKESLVSMLTCE